MKLKLLSYRSYMVQQGPWRKYTYFKRDEASSGRWVDSRWKAPERYFRSFGTCFIL